MDRRDLTLVGLSEDQSRLVLVSDAGTEFTLAVDDDLRAALRGDHARPGQWEITMESALRPRDIQARIRAGESPESVAAAAQTSLEKVMGYATPVLAERAHIADRAQRASVRRKAGEGPSRPLADAVAEELRSRHLDPDAVEWDSWRRDDGRWTLVADYRTAEGARRAEFVFDAPGKYVVAEDDEARRLVGEASERPDPAHGSRRLSAVQVDEELPLGEDAIEMVSGADWARPTSHAGGPSSGDTGDPGHTGDPGDTGGTGDSGGDEATVDLAQAARVVRTTRAARQAPDVDPGEPSADADWIATQATGRPAASADSADAQGPASGSAAEAAADPTPDSTAGATPDAQDPPHEDVGPAAEAEPPRSRKKGGRASVPSWDEIMFGGGKQD